MNISEKIFRIMDEKHLKQADLARKLNLKTGAIANWKVRGTTPPMEYATNICEFLGISIYELLDIEDCTDKKILDAYYAAEPGTQAAIRKLLDIPEDQDKISYTSKIG